MNRMADNGNVIDKLSIEIDGDISGAKKNIDKIKKTLGDLQAVFGGLNGIGGDVGAKLKGLADGFNAVAGVNTEDVKKATNAIKGFAKVDFSGISSIPSDLSDNLVAVADGVNWLSSQVDTGGVKRAVSALDNLLKFDFKGLSDNVKRLDPSMATRVRTFFEAFGSMSSGVNIGDNISSITRLFAMDFTNFTHFMETARTSLPALTDAIWTFSYACGSPDFQNAIDRLSMLANVDLSGFANVSSIRFQVCPDVSGQIDQETAETETAKQGLISTLASIFTSGELGFIFSGFKKLGGSIFGSINKAFDKLKAKAHKLTQQFTKLGRSIGRIAMYRSIRFVLNQIAQGFKEGTDNLYQYSKAINGEFAKSMDLLTTDLLYFRNSVAAATAPLINYLAPAIDYLTDRVVECLNWFNELTAKLTGASYWTKALKYPKEYAEATKDASKAMKDFQMGFDELNVINDSGSNSAADALDYSKMFTEMKVEADFEPWADAFREALEESDFYGAGVILGNKVKDVFENLPSDEWGSILAEKLNNAIDFADGFLSTHPFDEMGTSIAGFLNSALGDLNWYGLAETFSNGLNSILTGIDSFLIEFDAYDIAHKIGEGLSGFDLGETISNAGHVIHDFLNEVLDAANGFLEGVEWDKLGGDLFKGLSDFIFGNDWGETGGKAVDVIKNLGIALKDFAGGIGGEIVLNLFDDEQLDTWTVGAEEITGHIDSIKSSYQSFKNVVKEKGGIFKFLEGWGEYVYDEFHKGSDGAADFATEANATFDGVTIDADLWQESFNETMDKYVDNWKTGANDMKSSLSNLANNFKSKFDNIKSTVSETLTNVKSNMTTKMADIKNNFSEKVGIMKEDWSTGFNEIKTKMESKLGDIKTFFSEWDGLDKFKEKFSEAKNIISDKVTEMKDSISDTIGKIPDAIRGSANNIWEAIEQLINGMIQGFNHFADQMSEKFTFHVPDNPIVGAFDFGISIPHIPDLALGRFDNGGFPTMGELFMANENGVAEMVGRIGNRTAVANNDQIVAAVAEGVAQAVASVLNSRDNNGQNINIYLDSKQLAIAIEKQQRTRGKTIYQGGVVNA